MPDFTSFVPSIMQTLNPATGYQTAAAGARQAQGQANSLSDLQWQRQMAGLQQAQGYTNQLQSLYNSLYTTGHGQAAPGGLQSFDAPPMGAPANQGGMGMTLASMQPPGAKPPGAPNTGTPAKGKPSGTGQGGGWR